MTFTASATVQYCITMMTLIQRMHYYEYYIDPDQCEMGTHNCDENAKCINLDELFKCECNPGYTGSGIDCTGKQ